MRDSALPPLTWLRAFEASARHLSFTQAAGELHLTQSAISQHVRHLEGYLGRELFIRRTRSLALTEAGANYLPTVRQAFDILAAGTSRFTGGERGQVLKVQGNLAFSCFWLAPRIGRLRQLHPWLVVDLVTPIWDPEHHAGAATVEIRFGLPAAMGDGAKRMTQEHVYPVAAPGYAAGDPDWRRDPLFDCNGVTGNWQAWLSARGEALPEGAHVTLSSSYTFSLSAAREGSGLALGHDRLCGDLLASGALVKPFEGEIPLAEAYFLFSPTERSETPASRAFIAWLEEELAAS